MRFLDVGNKTIDSFRQFATKTYVIEDVEHFLDRKASEVGESIRKLMECEPMHQALLYDVELEGCNNIDDFEIICNIVTTCVINNNSRGGEENKFITKIIPQELEEVNCSVLPLIKAINVKNINSVYNIFIHCTRNCKEKYEFYLVGEKDE